MKKYLCISSFLLYNLFSSCTRDCPDSGTQTNYVDQAYLPDIIPYSNTSIRRFLRNGKDTLVFYSHGLKEIFESGSTLSSDCQKSYKNQQFSLKMAASDTDFFEIIYKTSYDNFKVGKFNMRNINGNTGFYYENFRKPYKPITSITVLNNKYDTINIFPINGIGTVYFKPNIGIVKINTPTFTYELIK
ncbi:MAG: hypothetical protein V4643_00140 [Bacteroidota bacterium]